MAGQGIFCLEGDWERDSLADHLSVRLGLDMLMTIRKDRLIHRKAATREEFTYFLRKWATPDYDDFPLAYLSYHGGRGRLDLNGSSSLTLEEIADIVPGRLAGRVVYFGSCATMAAPDDALLSFLATTGAAAIAGYTKNVDWEESAAFDPTLLAELLESTNFRVLDARLLRQHRHFVEALGLRIATPAWVSPRKRIPKTAGI